MGHVHSFADSLHVCMHVRMPRRVYYRSFTVCPHITDMKPSHCDIPASTMRTHALPTLQSPPDRQPGHWVAIVSDSSNQISKIAMRSAKSNHKARAYFATGQCCAEPVAPRKMPKASRIIDTASRIIKHRLLTISTALPALRRLAPALAAK